LVLGFQTEPSWPWQKSSETFSRQENLRFSRAFHARHVIHDVRHAVYPQPASVVSWKYLSNSQHDIPGLKGMESANS
jgi:hypothetical protein